MLKAVILVLLGGFTLVSVARGMSNASVEDAVSMVKRSDGRFDVTCVDGRVEIRTAEEIRSNEVCQALVTVTGIWKLVAGGQDSAGMRFCDLSLGYATDENAIISLHAEFVAPCSNLAGDTQVCTGKVCTMQINSSTFTFDFTAANLVLTRASDGIKGEFQQSGGGSTDRTRLATVEGVNNILQVSDGSTWLSVCDDEFNDLSAAVACRELGFGRADSYQIGVSVGSTGNFGMDDIQCAGEEATIWDCVHSAWGIHNCDSTEHVQLVCAE